MCTFSKLLLFIIPLDSENEAIESYDQDSFKENEDDDEDLQVVHEDLAVDRDYEEDDDDYEDEDYLETGEIRPNTWPRRNHHTRMKRSIGIEQDIETRQDESIPYVKTRGDSPPLSLRVWVLSPSA